MEIQRLTVPEGARLHSIRLCSLRDAPDAFGSTLEESAVRPLEFWSKQLSELATFVAVDGESDVGLVRGAPDEKARDTGWLISMWVAPEARGRGVGEALVDTVVGWARSEGFVKLLLDVGNDNVSAIALYTRKGFEPTGEVGALPPPREHIREHQRVLRLSMDPFRG